MLANPGLMMVFMVLTLLICFGSAPWAWRRAWMDHRAMMLCLLCLMVVLAVHPSC